MRITSIRQTTERVGDIVATTTDTLIIEGPDPEPSVTVNIDVKPALTLDLTKSGTDVWPRGGYIDSSRPEPEARYSDDGRTKYTYGFGGALEPEFVKDTSESFVDGPCPPLDEAPRHFDCHLPGENLAAFHEVHGIKDPFHNPKPGDRAASPAPVFDQHDFQAKSRAERKADTPIYYYELAGGRRPGRATRDIPLWAFQRDFLLQEFPSLGLHGAAKLADQFMDQWKRKFHK